MPSAAQRAPPPPGAEASPPGRARCWLLRWLVLAALLPAGCAQFGVPEFPGPLRAPPYPASPVYVTYDPYTVLGLGHTGVIVAAERPGRYLRYDQYASAEIAYGRRVARGEAAFWEGLTARLPSIFGFTREYVTRREGPSPAALLEPREYLVPIPAVDPAAVRGAAEARHRDAARLEQPGAPRYYWTANNCQTFVRDLLRAGGPIHEDSFPKHFVAAYLEDFRRGTAPAPARPPPAEPIRGP